MIARMASKVVGKVAELGAYYAPKEEAAEKVESRLDVYPFKVKLLVVACCALAEIIGYAILCVHYAQACSKGYGSMTCAYASDKEWEHSIVQQPGLRWISCYDTEGTAKGTTYTNAGSWNAIEVCSASVSDGGEIYDDDDQYTSDQCCDGWYNEDDCTPDDFCHNTLVMCEWEICPGFMDVYSSANGAMTGVHVIFSYVVVTLVIECLVKASDKRAPQGAEEVDMTDESDVGESL